MAFTNSGAPGGAFSANRPYIAVTMGDAAGVGPELCLKVLQEPSVIQACIPVVFGDQNVLGRVAARLGGPAPCQTMSLADWNKGGFTAESPLVVDCGLLSDGTVVAGQVQAACGRAAFGYIESAIASALRGTVAAVATAPINKEALRAAGYPYPGHTEIFEELTGTSGVCMMLASDEITVSMVTTHIGLADVSRHLSPERVALVIQLTADALRALLEREPRLSVCGLNPHAGEHGLFGEREEERLIEPGIKQARSRGIDVEGPFPPDTAFVPWLRQRFDAVVCMYHDQGHIPFKMLAFDKGVNITLGTPVIRTSVDHGTAFDIAWKGKADTTSMFQALNWAVRLAERRSASHVG
jgi:4-phospho-D-threonate 3-dehydrogenase / 4-phospho-D-erythronate 3-dehydrogenase